MIVLKGERGERRVGGRRREGEAACKRAEGRCIWMGGGRWGEGEGEGEDGERGEGGGGGGEREGERGGEKGERK